MKQDTLAKRLQIALDARNMKQVELVEKTGIPKGTISSYLANRYEPKQNNILKIAKALNVNEGWLMGFNVPMERTIQNLPVNLYTMIPFAVSAGELAAIDAMNSLPKVSIPDSLLGRYAGNKSIIFMPVNGESMNRIIQNDSMIAVRTDIELFDITDGDIVVIDNHGEYSVKRYYHDTENKRYIFRPDSDSPLFTDIVFPEDDCNELQLIGKVVMYNVFL